MDLPPIHYTEGESSSSASNILPHSTTTNQESSSATGERRNLRTSARVKAAKQKSQTKSKEKDLDSTNIEESATSVGATGEFSNSQITRTATTNIRGRKVKETNFAKGKGKEVIDEAPTRSSRRCVACGELN
jgi:E3 ubiquitin-protein ligase TRIP12